MPLTADDFALLAGANDTSDTELDPVIITGVWGGGSESDVPFSDWGTGGDPGSPGETTPPPPPPDSASVDVIVNFTRPLTEAERKAVENLKDKVAKTTTAINALPDDARVRLPNGDIVTGKELKALWANTDITINETGTTYANGTTRGEADYNGGDPKVSFNIDVVVGYNAHKGGLEYLVLHEVGHMTEAGRRSNGAMDDDGTITEAERVANEQVANDIARAIANAAGFDQLNSATHGYTTTAPIPFENPPSPPPTETDLGGGETPTVADWFDDHPTYGDHLPGTGNGWLF